MDRTEKRSAVKVGIDTFAFYTPHYALDLSLLAEARGADPEKFRQGLGQWMMAVPPPGEDIVTMAANAAKKALEGVKTDDIEMLLFATESGIDQSKAAGIYVHELLQLPKRCRTIELKQACYAATAGLGLALPFLRENPQKKILLIAADHARYGLGSVGESSQGAGAIAMVLSAHPRVIAFEREFGVVTEQVMDFWRPNYLHEALVDGKYSSKIYLTMLESAFQQYEIFSSRKVSDHDYFCFHTPVPRLVEKAYVHLQKLDLQKTTDTEEQSKGLQASLEYSRKMGNSYAASLYISLASLLDNSDKDLAGKRIGFYSYGSGCVAEFFSGVVAANYKQALHTAYHAKVFAQRKMLNYEEYETFYRFEYNEEGKDQTIPLHHTGEFRLTAMNQHKRIYGKVNIDIEQPTVHLRQYRNDKTTVSKQHTIKVFAPGKIILAGEHAIVHGYPALAMAVNRYATATITQETSQQIQFDLSDLAHQSRLSYTALHHLKDRIKNKYHRFIRGDFSIRDVLTKPFELAQVALGLFAEALNLNLPHGVKIQVQSDIPIGCGMGSSAATILSVMQALSNYMKVPMSADALYKLALEAENMQHGRSSGLDLKVAQQGGCLYINGNELENREFPEVPLFLVNTGMPSASTGQCVEKVTPFFKQGLGEDFKAVAQAMDAALRSKNWQAMQQAIQANHQLLVTIGVVPNKVQEFVTDVEKFGGAGKICGAGSIAGERAGAVIVTMEDKSVLSTLCMRYGYNMVSIAGDRRGVHAA